MIETNGAGKGAPRLCRGVVLRAVRRPSGGGHFQQREGVDREAGHQLAQVRHPRRGRGSARPYGARSAYVAALQTSPPDVVLLAAVDTRFGSNFEASVRGYVYRL